MKYKIYSIFLLGLAMFMIANNLQVKGLVFNPDGGGGGSSTPTITYLTSRDVNDSYELSIFVRATDSNGNLISVAASLHFLGAPLVSRCVTTSTSGYVSFDTGGSRFYSYVYVSIGFERNGIYESKNMFINPSLVYKFSADY